MKAWIAFFAVLVVLQAGWAGAGSFVLPGDMRDYIPDSGSALRGGRYGETIMQPDWETFLQWRQDSLTARKARIDKTLVPKAGSFNLLDYITYVPSERNQVNCGNCWTWAGTGCLEVTLGYVYATVVRLSDQFISSCYTDSSPCCGGNSTKFADWYEARGYCIPWSNTNGSFVDGSASGTCPNVPTLMPCGSIGTSPNYPISSCSAAVITTLNIPQATAIANIKNVLNQGKAVFFAFWLADNTDWNVFRDFWNNYTENYSINYSEAFNGHAYGTGFGGHAVLCVGYDDTNPDFPYWIMVNSWGIGSSGLRTNGIFLVDMDMDYSCYYTYGAAHYAMLEWDVIDAQFNISPAGEGYTLGDYNGDGKADIAVFKPSTGQWSVRDVTRVYFGNNGTPLVGDFNGDKKSDIAAFIPGTGVWSVRNYTRFNLGGTGDTPVVADFSGDGKFDFGVYRQSTGLWSVKGITRVYLGGADSIQATH